MSAASALAFLFPGQGSQSPGMGRSLADTYPIARQTFEEADEALGYSLSELCFQGPADKLKLTEITQPAILTVSVAAFRVLQEQGVHPAWAGGHSLGEYSAHVATGTLTFSDAVRTVSHRGKYMQEAVAVGVGAMAAIIGLPVAGVEEICRESAQGQVVSAANINSPEQVVISGDLAAVERAAEAAKRKGAKRAIMLPVSAPFHCALMQPAQDRLAAELKTLEFGDPRVPVVKNIDGELCTAAASAREGLIHQVTGAVQWVKCVRTLLAAGARTFVEVGPGKVLCGLMRQMDRSSTCGNVEDENSLQKTMQILRGKS